MSDALLTASWRHELLLWRDATTQALRAQLLRGLQSGDLVRIARGAYLATATDLHSTASERHLWRLRAAALTHEAPLVFSHLSAACVWGLPNTGDWPARPHVAVRGREARSSRGLNRHPGDGITPIEIDGLLVAPLPRTVIDVGRSAPLSVALPMADQALPGNRYRTTPVTSREALTAELPPASVRGGSMARLVVALADGRSGSAGESLSRAGMHVLGVPMPELQVRFEDTLGLIGETDFYWRDHRLVGEFDGRGKYLREELRSGRDAGEVVYDEKVREDRLRALGEGVTRWGWASALNLSVLRRILASAGLRPTTRVAIL